MVIEITEKGTRNFYEEVVNITSQYRDLIKKPDRRLRNNFRSLKTYILICAAFLIAFSLMAVFWGADTLTAVGIVLIIIVILLCGTYLHNMNNMVKTFLADERHSVLTLDENGVELEKPGSKTVRLSWDNVAFVRVFDESVCFLAKDSTGFVIAVNRGRREEILEYLKTAGTPVTVIAS